MWCDENVFRQTHFPYQTHIQLFGMEIFDLICLIHSFIEKFLFKWVCQVFANKFKTLYILGYFFTLNITHRNIGGIAEFISRHKVYQTTILANYMRNQMREHENTRETWTLRNMRETSIFDHSQINKDITQSSYLLTCFELNLIHH